MPAHEIYCCGDAVKIGTAGISKISLPALNMLVRVFLACAYVAMGATLAIVCSTYAAAHFGTGISQLIVYLIVFMEIVYYYCYTSEICALSETKQSESSEKITLIQNISFFLSSFKKPDLYHKKYLCHQ